VVPAVAGRSFWPWPRAAGENPITPHANTAHSIESMVLDMVDRPLLIAEIGQDY
jgi:hypothetical protein